MRIINIAQAGPMESAIPVSIMVENVAKFLVSVLGIVAVIVIMIAGIMYMTSGGDINRAQSAKKVLLGGFVGFSIALLAFTIVNIISRLA